MKTSMSAKRLLSLFAASTLAVVVLLTVQARITASNVVSSPQAAADQAVARDPRYNPSSPQAAADRAVARDPRYNPSSAAALAEQARLEFRRGEWNAGSRSSQSYDMPAASNVVSNPQAAVDQAGSSSSQPYYRSVVPTPGWRMAPTSDYALVGRSFHTPPTSPDRHR